MDDDNAVYELVMTYIAARTNKKASGCGSMLITSVASPLPGPTLPAVRRTEAPPSQTCIAASHTLTVSPAPPYRYIAAWSHYPNQPHPAPGSHQDSHCGLLECCAQVDAK